MPTGNILFRAKITSTSITTAKGQHLHHVGGYIDACDLQGCGHGKTGAEQAWRRSAPKEAAPRASIARNDADDAGAAGDEGHEQNPHPRFAM
jgi:hypothetical protein